MAATLAIRHLPGGLFCAIGNPLNDGTWTCTWQDGRQLQKMQKSGETVEFVYNENGLRVQKTATSTGETKYTLHGKNIVHMAQGSNELHFFYDAQNKPAVVVYNGTPYSYVKNLQGDIVAILDSNKNVVVSYVYDAWGRPISKTGTLASTLGTVQPFRYRGYIYDEETELYYLRSRYYNFSMCRFLIADMYISTDSGLFDHEMYLYCKNRPVFSVDPLGTWTFSISIGFDLTFFWAGCSGTIGISIDDDWDVAVQTSYSAPVTGHIGLVDAGIGVSVQITDADNVSDLNGISTYVGASGGKGWYGGVDLVYNGVAGFDRSSGNAYPNGIALNAGFGVGIDMHFKQTVTDTLWSTEQEEED